MLKNIPETARTLLKAADIIRERGHWRGGAKSRPGTTCLVLAIYEAEGAKRGPAFDAIKSYFKAEYIGDVMDWNDAHTEAEVLAAIEAAAAQVAAETVG